MRRKLNREELSETSPLLEEKARYPLYFHWVVYEDYEVVDQGGDHPYLRAKPGDFHRYCPLTDRPYLFLEFARIADQKNPEQALHEWIAKHGLLGLSRTDYSFSQEPLEEYPELVVPPLFYDDKGGPGETLAAVWYEVEEANEALAFYEAALARDEDELERILRAAGVRTESLEEEHQRHREWTGNDYELVDYMIDRVLRMMHDKVNEQLSTFTYPEVLGLSHPQALNKVSAILRPRNLLGAMYLQFFWLITSAGDLSRCKYCRRIISHARPILNSGGEKRRKPRSDKVFCDERCQQNYYYHNKRKPKRQKKATALDANADANRAGMPRY